MASEQQEAVANQLLGEGVTVSAIDGSMHTLRGDVLTAPGRQLAVVPTYQSYFAFIADGSLLVAQGRRFDAHIATFKQKLNERGTRIERTVEVSIETLKTVYAHAHDAARAKGSKADVPENDSRMRREIVELVARAASVDASDIHLLGDNQTAWIRVRLDGILVDLPFTNLETPFLHQMMKAAFSMATASDATYTANAPQGGSIIDVDGQLGLPRSIQSIRCQWNPTMLNGRELVMRLHKAAVHTASDLDGLGFAKMQLAQVARFREKSAGMIVISGPTGHGKSTSLKIALSALYRLRRGEISIRTVEDPPEGYIKGLVQMQVVNASTAEERRERYVQAIMAGLRSDPDVIMIGEVRDGESAKIGYEYANTGHGTWTSVHANTGHGVLYRLMDLGLEPWKVTDHETMVGLIGQRLVRKLCPHCKKPLHDGLKLQTTTEAQIERVTTLLKKIGRPDAEIFTHNPKGCSVCKAKAGFAGRTVVAEVISPDEKFMALTRDYRKTDAQRHWIEHLNGVTMMTHAVSKMLAGELSPDVIEKQLDHIEHDISMEHLPKLLKEYPRLAA